MIMCVYLDSDNDSLDESRTFSGGESYDIFIFYYSIRICTEYIHTQYSVSLSVNTLARLIKLGFKLVLR